MTWARGCVPFLCGLMTAALTASSAVAAPVLRSADIRIEMTSASSCNVTMTLAIEGAAEIDHRVDGDAIDLAGVEGAQQVGEPRVIGRTRSLVLRPTASPYTIRYRAGQLENRGSRCPMWLPTVPTDGRSRDVRIEVSIPESSAVRGSMPAFTWNGNRGSTTLAHVPAFVRVPLGSAGARSWDLARVMDLAAIAVFAAATALWIWRRSSIFLARSAR